MANVSLGSMLIATGAALCAASSEAQTSAAVSSGTAAPILVSSDAPASPVTSNPSNSQQLQEVVVTATKRAQAVRDIPSTVNVLTGAKLESQGARELQDFVDQVPGLKIEDVALTNTRKIAIRGVGPDDTTNATVGMVLGDIPLGDPFGSYTVIDPDPWDLKTVEVLKGPQGTLFGASSLAGLIRYVPNGPDLGQWEGKAFSEWVSVKEGGTEPTYGGAINIPIGSTLAFRASGIVEHAPGVIDIDTIGRQAENADYSRKWSGRFMGLWQPTKRLSVNAWYMSQQKHAEEMGFVTNFNGQLSRDDAPSASPTHRAFSLASVDARYAFDWATLVSLSGYQHKVNQFNVDGSYALVEPLAQEGVTVERLERDVDANGLVQELRLVSPDGGPWTWQGGAFYSAYHAYIQSDIYIPNTSALVPVLGALPDNLGAILASGNGVSLGNQVFNPAEAGEKALFGEVTRKLGPVGITLGGRLYRTEVDGTSVVAGALASAASKSPKTTSALDVRGQGFSPKAAITWQAAKDVMFYSSASRGFQYGGVNIVAIPSPTDSIPPTYKSSTLWSYETGVRTDWFHKTVRADVTGFYQRWSNAQVSQLSGSQTDEYVDNVGQVVSRGFEWSFRYLPPLKGLSLETNGDYLQSRTSTPFTNANGVLTPSGTDMPNAPRLQIGATLAYSRAFDDAWRTRSALDYTHTNSGWNDIEHDHVLDARNMFNLNWSVTRSDLSFAPTIGLIVNNLTDQKKIVSVVEIAETASNAATEAFPVVYTRPRTVILRISADF